MLLLLRELQFVGKLIPEPFEQCPGFFRVSFAQVLKFPLMRTGNQFPLMLRLFFQRFQRGKRLRRGDTAGFRLRFDRFRLGKTRFQSIRLPPLPGRLCPHDEKSKNTARKKSQNSKKKMHRFLP